MEIPTIKGVIERRILINYQVEANVLANVLPPPFRPKLIDGAGIAGICLIRLKHIRPAGFPAVTGIGSENAAHRIAVQWNENDVVKEGVFVPRRDTNSYLNHLAGGNIFPGVHHLSDFEVDESNGSYEIRIVHEREVLIDIKAKTTDHFHGESIFKDIDEASDFFKSGAVGFSPNKKSFDGLELKTEQWKVQPLHVEMVRSHFFENEIMFPRGSVKFDNALLMQNIDHTWNSYNTKPDNTLTVHNEIG